MAEQFASAEPPRRRVAAEAGAAARRGTEAGADELRLDEDEVHLVLARAIRLQDAVDGRHGDGLAVRDVRQIAAQVGVSPELVSRALVEVRQQQIHDAEPSLTERLLGPASVSGVAVLPLDTEAAREAAERWMTEDEGLRLVGRRGDVTRWRKDPRLLAGLRQGLGVNRSEGVLRGLRQVDVAVEEGPAGTEVTVVADTRPIQYAARGILGSGIVGGLAIGLANAAVIPDTAPIASDLAQFAVTWGASIGIASATALSVVSVWRDKVRDAIDRALDGVSLVDQPGQMPSLDGAAGWRQAAMRWLGGD